MPDPSARDRLQHAEDLTIPHRPPETSSDLETMGDIYLRVLRQKAASTTYHSHKRTLAAYRDWHPENGSINNCLDEECVARFVEELLTTTSLSTSTVSGYICTLANFLAYWEQNDPELVKASIIAEFNPDSASNLDEVKSHILRERDWRPTRAARNAVNVLVSDLRQRQFGTRTHAFVEVLLDPQSRPGPLQQLELSNLNLENNTLVIEIPETHVVSSAGLVTERVVQLTPQATDALNTYANAKRPIRTVLVHSSLPQTGVRVIRRSVAQLSRRVKRLHILPSRLLLEKSRRKHRHPGINVRWSFPVISGGTPSQRSLSKNDRNLSRSIGPN